MKQINKQWQPTEEILNVKVGDTLPLKYIGFKMHQNEFLECERSSRLVVAVGHSSTK
jgi:hypothetical protein